MTKTRRVPMTLPTLRGQGEDVALLTEQLISRVRPNNKAKQLTLFQRRMAALGRYEGQGHSGELQHIVDPARVFESIVATVMNREKQLMTSAEREMGAFLRTVSELFGTEQARRAADDWLTEFERMDTVPESARDLRAITIAAAVRLTTWLNANSGRRVYSPRCN